MIPSYKGTGRSGAPQQSSPHPAIEPIGVPDHSRQGHQLGLNALPSTRDQEGKQELEASPAALIDDHLDLVDDDRPDLGQEMGVGKSHGRKLLVSEQADVELAQHQRLVVVANLAGRADRSHPERSVGPLKLLILVVDQGAQREEKDSALSLKYSAQSGQLPNHRLA
jgi:hypothetical protein